MKGVPVLLQGGLVKLKSQECVFTGKNLLKTCYWKIWNRGRNIIIVLGLVER